MTEIGKILPDVLRDIKKRCKNNPDNEDFKQADYKANTFNAVCGFFENHRGANSRKKKGYYEKHKVDSI